MRVMRMVVAVLLGGVASLAVVAPTSAAPNTCAPEEVEITGEKYEVTRTDGTWGDPGSFAWAVEQANASPDIDEIVLASGVMVTSPGGAGALTNSVVLRGEDDSAGFIGGISYYGDETLDVCDLTFTGDPEQGGTGGVNADTLGVARFKGVTLRDIKATGFEVTGAKSLVFEDSLFENNQADLTSPNEVGAAIAWQTNQENPTFTIKNTRFVNNDITLVKTFGSLKFTSEDGGITIENSTFQGNEAPESDFYTGAGPVTFASISARERHGSLISIRDTLFENNSGSTTGGIAVQGGVHEKQKEFAAVEVERSTFVNNRTFGMAHFASPSTDLSFKFLNFGTEDSRTLSIQNSTFVNENILGNQMIGTSAVPNLAMRHIGGTIDVSHSTFVGSGIDWGYGWDSTRTRVAVRDTVFDTGALDPMRGPFDDQDDLFEVVESHNAYTTAPEHVTGGQSRIVVGADQAGKFELASLSEAPGEPGLPDGAKQTPVLVPGPDSVLLGKGSVTSADGMLDQRGQARLQGLASDIGAVERLSQPDLVRIGADQQGAPGDEFTFTVSRPHEDKNLWAGEVGVRVMTEDGSAVAGTDYEPVDEVLKWGAGDFADKTVKIRTKAGTKKSLQFSVVLSEPAEYTKITKDRAMGTLAVKAPPVDPPVDPPIEPGEKTDPPVAGGGKPDLARTGGAEGFPLMLVGGLLVAGAIVALVARRRRV